MKTIILSRRIYTPQHLLEDIAIQIQDGKILDLIAMDKVKDFINSKEYKADINNNEFLDNVAMLDYQAAKRAASAVDELVKK